VCKVVPEELGKKEMKILILIIINNNNIFSRQKLIVIAHVYQVLYMSTCKTDWNKDVGKERLRNYEKYETLVSLLYGRARVKLVNHFSFTLPIFPLFSSLHV